MAILTTVESALPNATIFSGISQILGVAWVSLSVSFNVLVTALICGRVFVSYLALKRMGLASHARERWGLVAILIESSLPFSIFGIVFACVYSLPPTNSNSQLVGAMADTWGGIVVSTSLLLGQEKVQRITIAARRRRGYHLNSSSYVWLWGTRGRKIMSAQGIYNQRLCDSKITREARLVCCRAVGQI